MKSFLICSMCICLLVSGVMAQPELSSSERDFVQWSKNQREYYFRPGSVPQKGYKSFERSKLWLEDHLDKNGKIFNYAKSDYEELLQLKSTNPPEGSEWDFVGPYGPSFDPEYSGPGVGRVNCLHIHNATTWFVGASSGGLWKTTYSGIYLPGVMDQPWENLTRNMPLLSISGIAVNPTNEDEIWILTGDPFNYGVPSLGLFHTTDGGENWNETSLTLGREDLSYGYNLVVNPLDHLEMYACLSSGLYYTQDGWVTHSIVLNDKTFDLEYHPTDTSVVYAATSNQIWKKQGGTDFQQSSAGINTSGIARVELAVTPGAPDWVYAVTIDEDRSLGSIYLSMDQGSQFDLQAGGSYNLCASSDPEDPDDKGQGNYNVVLEAHPEFPMILYYGCVNLWVSGTMGLEGSWVQVSDWESDDDFHADQHWLEFNPYNGDLMATNDGGFFVSADGGDSWENRSYGLHITEFYALGVDNNSLFTLDVAGGAQDNGTILTSAIEGYVVHEELMGGDGFGVHINTLFDTGMEYYSMVQFGDLRYTGYSVLGTSDISPDFEEVQYGIENKTNRFNTPYQVNKYNWDELLIGYRNLYYSNDRGDDWVMIWEPDYIYDETSIRRLDFNNSSNAAWIQQYESGSSNHYKVWYSTSLISNVISPGMWVEQVYHDSLGISTTLPITDVRIKPWEDPSTSVNYTSLTITCGGYDSTHKVLYIPDLISKPDSVINLTYDLPNVPVLCVEVNDDGIYIGTDIGVFYLMFGALTWQNYTNGLPSVPVTQIEFKETVVEGRKLYVSTYGRGIWRNDLAGVTRVKYYVDVDAVGANDGSSWENAYTSLSAALQDANPGDTLWIAEGVYTPGASRQSKFYIDGELLYGGFNGTEDSLSQRDPSLHVTRLSGDIGVPGTATDNVYRLLSLNEFDNHCYLDGLTLSDAYANGAATDEKRGGCFRTTTFQPGNPNGTYATKRPFFKSCTFENFYAQGNGAVFYYEDFTKVLYSGSDAMADIPVTFDSCVFRNNAAVNGGAIYVDITHDTTPSNSGDVGLDLINCTFQDNTATNGGALYLDGKYVPASKQYSGLTFHSNEVTGSGGAVYVNGSSGGDFTVVFSTCNFTENLAASWGGAVHHYAGRNNSNSSEPGVVSATYHDCLFHANHGDYGGTTSYNAASADFDDGTINATYRDCVITDNVADVYGGFIFADISSNGSFGNFSFEDCDFTNNDASLEGGAIKIEGANYGVTTLTMNQCSVVGSNAGGRGGAIYCEAFVNGDFTFTADSCFFGQNAGDHGGALYFSTGANGNLHSHVTNSQFTENFANGASNNSRGGAITHNGDNINTGVYENCTFLANHSNERGGAFAVDASDITFSQCTFEGNYSVNNGGVGYIYHFYSDLEHTITLDSCHIEGNYVNGGSGGIHASLSNSPPLNIIVNASDFIGNYGSTGCFEIGGGGVSNVTIDNSYFNANSTVVSGRGGVMKFSAAGSVQISNSLFDANTSGYMAGSLELTSYSNDLTIAIDSCTFQNGDSDLGGAIRIANDNFTSIYADIVDCHFLNNEADNGIGAVMVELYDYSEVNLLRNQFIGNHSLSGSYSTGALYFKTYSASDTSWVHLDSCHFDGNEAPGAAGALHFVADGSMRALVENSDFVSNSTNLHGGAARIYVYVNDYADVDFSNCLFDGNTALSRGGALHYEASTGTSEVYGTINQCVFVNNQGAQGGAVHSYITGSGAVSGVEILNSTIANNHATTKCGGAMAERTNGTMNGNYRNSIFWGNTDSDTEVNQKQVYVLGTAAMEVGSSDVAGGLPAGVTDAGGNTDADPLFLDPLSVNGADSQFRTTDDGFSLQSGSPLIDLADAAFMTDADIAGTARPQFNAGDPGAYEAVFVAVACVGDLNGDAIVGTSDLLLFMSQYGCTASCGLADLTGDDLVNISDLLIFMSAYGSDCNP